MNRKSLKDISWNVSEETYRADPAYSYSTLAKFHREGFENLTHLFDKTSSPSLTFGSMVDTLLTDGEEAFNARFFSAEFPDTPPSIIEIVKALFNDKRESENSLSGIDDITILNYINSFNYQPRWKDATRVNDVVTKGSAYYDMLLLADGKEVVTSKEKQDAYDCVEILRTDPKTRWYFQKDNPFDGIERLYQLKFKGEYDSILLRGMMDLVLVDHKNKIIYPCDLKTSYKPEYKFFKSFVEWDYFIQSNLYAELIRQNIAKDEYFKDFKIADYRFIVICNRTRNPLVWEWTHTWDINNVVLGNYTLPNWRGIVKELHYYLTKSSKAPIGIVDGCNSISKWLESNG